MVENVGCLLCMAPARISSSVFVSLKITSNRTNFLVLDKHFQLKVTVFIHTFNTYIIA